MWCKCQYILMQYHVILCENILCLIGEAFENSEEVCGAVVNIRGKGDKIGNA
ncbi:translation initiation factor [Holotrichia oblita]|uniref:Translation initiation factor n=1 Tax=Holotrichia oblita TaxID=644536 RepID=A0ACB9TDH9_HOLOL|nr:translation initiation factor [Holotrichia oblita]